MNSSSKKRRSEKNKLIIYLNWARTAEGIYRFFVNHNLPNYPYCGSEIGSRVPFFHANSCEYTYCRDMDHKFESLPGHATELLLAFQFKAASGLKLLP